MHFLWVLILTPLLLGLSGITTKAKDISVIYNYPIGCMTPTELTVPDREDVIELDSPLDRQVCDLVYAAAVYRMVGQTGRALEALEMARLLVESEPPPVKRALDWLIIRAFSIGNW